MNDENLADGKRRAWWWALAEVLLIVLVFFIVAGDTPPQVNEAHYLSRLKHYWDPTWCAGDLFLESKDTQLAFIWLFGWITRFASLTATAWIGRAAAWGLLAWSWERLSWRLVPRPMAAVLSATLFVILNTSGHMAGEWVVGGVEAKCFAYAFVLFALREVVDGRWNLVWLFLGAATAFHPIVGGWSGVICVGVWMVDGRHEQKLLAMWPGFIAGGAVALVGILPALTLTWGVPAETVAESNRIYVFARLAHHLAPLSTPPGEPTRRLGGHALLLVVLFLLSRLPLAPLRRVVLFAWGGVLLAVIGLAIEIALLNQPILAAKLLKYYWFRLTDFAAAMAVALYIVALIAAGFERRRLWAGPLLLAATATAGWFLANVSWTRYEDWDRFGQPLPVADNRLANFPAWVEACDWVAQNTPRDALFITPRLNQSFKWRAGRAEVANRKDLPQDAGSIIAWQDRIKDVYTLQSPGEVISVDSVGALGTDRVKELAKKYHVQFVLSDRVQLLELPVAYRNDEYVVYRIEN